MTKIFDASPDGWVQDISDDGQKVAFGNEIMNVVHVPNPAAIWPVATGQGFRSIRFLDNDRVQWIKDLTLQPPTTQRYVADLRAFNPNPPPTNDDINLVPGNDYAAANGHWASALVSGRRVVEDNRVIATNCTGVRMSGEYLLTIWADTTFVVYKNGQQVATYPRIDNEYEISKQGWITTGYYGPTHLITPDGRVHDITVTPWKREGVAQLVHLPDGSVWAWTATVVNEADSNSGIVVGRPLIHHDDGSWTSDPNCIVLQNFPANVLKVGYWDGQGFTVAGSANLGKSTPIQVHVVPVTTARTQLVLTGPKPITSIPTLPRKLWLGYYKTQGRYGDFVQRALGGTTNCTLFFPNGDTDLTTQNWQQQLVSVCENLKTVNGGLITYITAEMIPILKSYWNLVVAAYVSPEGSGVQFEDISGVNQQATTARNLMRQAGLPVRPVVCYFDGHLDANFKMPDVDWIAIQTYLDPSQASNAAQALRDTVASSLARVPAGIPVTLAAQAYDRNGAWTDINALIDVQPVYADLARQYPQILGLWYFSYSRPGGVVTYPQLQEWHKQIYQANSGRPDILTIGGTTNPVTNKPTITITDWSRSINLGERAWVVFTIGGTVPVPNLSVDLVGDGRDGWAYVVDDARKYGKVYFTPVIQGTFSVSLGSQDSQGNTDQTGAYREIVIH